jgi:plastocyanin
MELLKEVRKLKSNKSLIILLVLGVVLAVFSVYGYRLISQKEKESASVFNPAATTGGEVELVEITPPLTIPPEVPAEMREKLTKGGALKRLQAKITASGFEPKTININVGDVVIWTNEDQVNHQLQDSEDRWNSEVLTPGATHAQVFDVSGTYEYACKLNSNLKGTVVVEK